MQGAYAITVGIDVLFLWGVFLGHTSMMMDPNIFISV